MQRDTIFAHSSGRPPAAIAVIRISGPEAHRAGQALAGALPPVREAAVRRLRDQAGEVLDDALVLSFSRPNSATGEDVVEFHCHGSRAVVAAVLGTLRSLNGPREAEPGEFTRRAFESGRIDLTEAEGLADLLEAETESQRRAALALAEGGLRRAVEHWRTRLVELSARAEAAIDYVGDDDETAIDLPQLVLAADAIRTQIRQKLAEPRAERLKEGVRVVIAGPPNRGKSSLLNALAEQDRAIVTPVAGTTRDMIEVPVAWDGIPLVLVDTAGLRESADPVEQIGVEFARRHVEAADLLLWTGDSAEAPEHARMLQLNTKADVGDTDGEGLPVSVVTGQGLSQLRQWIIVSARQLLPGETSVVLNRRQAEALESCADALGDVVSDLVLTAEALRSARVALDRVTGRTSTEEVLDSLFGRFCLGK